MVFKPFPCPAFGRAIAVGLAALLVELIIVRWLFSRPIDGWSFVLAIGVMLSLGPLVVLAYRTYGTATLEYWIDRDALTVAWASSQYIVPLPQIRQILYIDESIEQETRDTTSSSSQPSKVGNWLRWPAVWVGEETIRGIGTVHSFATVPAPYQLLIVTDQGTYGVSPAQPERFVQALQERHRLGPGQIKQEGAIQPAWWTMPAWHDRIALAVLGLTLCLNLALFGYLAMRYTGLPDNVPLHFDAFGKPDRIGERSALFILPLIGLLVLSVNALSGFWLYFRQRLGSYLLWAGALLIQILVWLAAHNLVAR